MKHLFTILIASLLVLSVANGSFAASAKCMVVERVGSRLVIDCGEKGEKISEGSKIKIKTVKMKQIEGC